MSTLTEIIDLPSKGIFYPETNPLSKGSVEIQYMTARHEDILTSRSLIQKGLVLNKLLSELIVDKTIKIEDMLIGDRTALMIASRIMGYGKEYPIKAVCTRCDTDMKPTINLETLSPKKTDIPLGHTLHTNELTTTLPLTKAVITFRLPTVGSSMQVEQELNKLEELTKSDVRSEVTSRIRNTIISINGNSDGSFIKTFVEQMPVRDSTAYRKLLQDITPDVNMSTDVTCEHCGLDQPVEVAISANFFWPNARV